MEFYPRPQFRRDKWQSLDGQWDFAFDDNRIGIKQKWFLNHEYSQKITVPYAYQCKASGIDIQEVHDCVWYSNEWQLEPFSEEIVRLHFGASDYHTKVWVNGSYCGEHSGGHSPFYFDISNYIEDNYKVKIDVCVVDYSYDEMLPRGKQNFKGKSEGIFYTDTTGIWQSVWLEYLEANHIETVKYIPNTLKNEIQIIAAFHLNEEVKLNTKIYRENTLIIDDVSKVSNDSLQITFEIPDFNDHHFGHWWSPESPNLYDVEFSLLMPNGETVDKVESYFGMRSVSIEENRFCLNHMPFYTKSILYQGYYPDSLMTAKSDEEIKNDVLLIKQMGFNSVRLHQKFENPNFLYWCDRLGLVVWGEAPNAYSFSNDSMNNLISEWTAIMKRDYNHPSICVWVPLNESWGVPKIKNEQAQRDFATAMYLLTKAMDPTRIAVSNDGWEHTISDICTIHDYESQTNSLLKRYSNVDNILVGPQNRTIYVKGYNYNNEPIILSEFGGISFDLENYGVDSWGYSGATSQADFEEKVLRIIETVQESPLLQGYCYTQFNDLEQETNGLLTMKRNPKLDIVKLKEVNDRR